MFSKAKVPLQASFQPQLHQLCGVIPSSGLSTEGLEITFHVLHPHKPSGENWLIMFLTQSQRDLPPLPHPHPVSDPVWQQDISLYHLDGLLNKLTETNETGENSIQICERANMENPEHGKSQGRGHPPAQWGAKKNGTPHSCWGGESVDNFVMTHTWLLGGNLTNFEHIRQPRAESHGP